MKKSFFLFLIAILVFSFTETGTAGTTVKRISTEGISSPEEYFAMAKKKKRRKPKSKSKSKKGKGSSITAAAGGGLFLGLPMGDFGTAYKTGMGLDVEAEYFMAPTFSVGFNTGYFNFKLKADSITTGSAKVSPMLLKGTIYLSEGAFKPFIGLGVGMFYAHSKLTISVPTLYSNPVTGQDELLNLRTEFDDQETKPGVAPNLGFLYGVTDNLNVMFDARYNMMFSKESMGIPKSLSFIGINLGILLSF